jgi:acylphosphatase
MIKTFEIIVKGKVQGVWFRMHTQKTALSLAITGTVENQADGSVKVRAQGKSENLEKFIEWLKIGPALARVDELKITEFTDEEYLSFEVLR